jgi:hypothetical protein
LKGRKRTFFKKGGDKENEDKAFALGDIGDGVGGYIVYAAV